MASLDDVVRQIAHDRDRTERLLAELIETPSVRGEATEIHRVVERELEALGMVTARIQRDPASLRDDPEWTPPTVRSDVPVNVVGRWEGEEPQVVLFAHLDTEPVGDEVAWSTSPLEATVRDGWVHGLGAADDKAGIASIVAALWALTAGRRPPGLVVAFHHAKDGGSMGSLPVWRTLPISRGAIYCHPAETGNGLAEMKVASRGIATVEIEVAGRTPAPREQRTPVSADPREGKNAVRSAARVIEWVDAWSRTTRAWRVLGEPTSIRSGGGDDFETPALCTLRFALRFERGTVREVTDSLRRWLDRRMTTERTIDAGSLTIRLVGLRADPAATDQRSAVVRAVSRAISEVTGSGPARYGHHAASDIRFPLRCTGTPAVGFGARGDGFYGPNERVELRSLHASTEVLVRAILRVSVRGGLRRLSRQHRPRR